MVGYQCAGWHVQLRTDLCLRSPDSGTVNREQPAGKSCVRVPAQQRL